MTTSKPIRIPYSLTGHEIDAFNRLFPKDSDAFKFWRSVADARNLDPKSIVTVQGHPYQFTGLPAGHRQHWCYPSALKMTKARPLFVD